MINCNLSFTGVNNLKFCYNTEKCIHKTKENMCEKNGFFHAGKIGNIDVFIDEFYSEENIKDLASQPTSSIKDENIFTYIEHNDIFWNDCKYELPIDNQEVMITVKENKFLITKVATFNKNHFCDRFGNRNYIYKETIFWTKKL